MTPNELLESVKDRFVPLLHDNEKSLRALLIKALGKYQDHAGFMTTMKIPEDNADVRIAGYLTMPSNVISRVCVKDSNGRFVPSQIWTDKLELSLTGQEVYPLLFTYFETMLNADFDQVQIPPSATTLIADYLELLISIPNSERLRRVTVAGKLDTSDIPTESDLAARKAEIEADMKASRAMLPTFSLF